MGKNTNRNNTLKITLIIFSLFVVLFPIYIWYLNADFVWDKLVLFEVFPVFGLIAFSVMWLHIVGGAFRRQLESAVDFQKFVDISSAVVLVALLLHPILLFIALNSSGTLDPYIYVTSGDEYLITIAFVAWFVFVGYDVLKKFKGREIISKHWEKIKLVSTLAFFLALIHSLGVGSDLQNGTLRLVWCFYGISAGIATIYSYLFKPFFKNKS